jgi:hypothetical protein
MNEPAVHLFLRTLPWENPFISSGLYMQLVLFVVFHIHTSNGTNIADIRQEKLQQQLQLLQITLFASSRTTLLTIGFAYSVADAAAAQIGKNAG